MENQTFNISAAKMHLSRLIDRVERGESITIARNNKPVAIMSPAKRSASDILAAIDDVRERISSKRRGNNVLRRGETWRGFIHEGHSRD